ncbi:MAG TPA: sugar ABC transporter substrate-binding protein [Pseudonocardiaceae bacterium]|jgi:simple sugar transport system substrate-binding protein/ribose transport system substrate-binding protein|nr:sugar ABC transporter substrate-binding protein [Pseudonocardiaceae bacterium]
MHLRTAWKAVAVAAATMCVLAGCNSSASSGSGPKIGLDLPRSDTDFWVAYAKYVPQEAKDLGVNLMPTTNSQNDITKLASNVQALVSQGAKAVVIAPQDTGAVVGTLNQLANKNIPVVTVDTRPDSGKVYMVVRADNVAYGQKSCMYLGQQLKGTGKVVDLEGALDSINGRDRTNAFNTCMKQNFPGITVYGEPTDWDSAKGAAALQTVLTQHPDISGIYSQAGGVFLAPTLQVLKSAGKLIPAGQPGHITIVSNDGIPAEFTAIRQGYLDATVSQPADLYAKYALYYAQAALAGKTFKPGPTDHGSTIVSWGNGNLEDELPAPLVTKANVNDKSLWGNQISGT